MLLALTAAASAADLQFTFITEDGLVQKASWSTDETYTLRLGPQVRGPTAVTYEVTVPPAVYDPAQKAYLVDLSVCLDWDRKTEDGNYCDPVRLVAKSDPAAPAIFTQTVKDKDKFTYTVELYWSGTP
jgi:hypothetical protein